MEVSMTFKNSNGYVSILQKDTLILMTLAFPAFFVSSPSFLAAPFPDTA